MLRSLLTRRRRAVALAGLLVVAVLEGFRDLLGGSDVDLQRALGYSVDALYVVILGVVGLLARRRGTSVTAVLLWVSGAVVLGLDDAYLFDLARAYDWGLDTTRTVARLALTVMVTCFAAAYLAARRAPGARYAFVPLVFVATGLWFVFLPDAFEQAGVSITSLRLENAVILAGGTALMAGIVYVSGKALAGVPAGGPGGPQGGWQQQGWPSQPQWQPQWQPQPGPHQPAPHQPPAGRHHPPAQQWPAQPQPPAQRWARPGGEQGWRHPGPGDEA